MLCDSKSDTLLGQIGVDHGLLITGLTHSLTQFAWAHDVWASLGAQMVKHLPAMEGTWVQSLCQEDPLEKEMTTHSSTLAWRIPWTEEPGRLQFTGSQRGGHD